VNEFEDRIGTLLARMAAHAPTALPGVSPTRRPLVPRSWRGPIAASLAFAGLIGLVVIAQHRGRDATSEAQAAETGMITAGDITIAPPDAEAPVPTLGADRGTGPIWDALAALGADLDHAPASVRDLDNVPFCGVHAHDDSASSHTAAGCFLDAVAASTPAAMVEFYGGDRAGAVIVRLRGDERFDHITSSSHFICEGILTDSTNSSPPPPDDPFFFKIHGCGYEAEPRETALGPQTPEPFRTRTALPPCAYVLAVAMTRPVHLDCLKSAMAADERAEMVVRRSAGTTTTAEWFRHSPGVPDEVWRMTRRIENDAQTRSWELLRCGTFVFGEDSVNNWLPSTESCTVEVTIDQ
jgi:hypothetical protein